MPTAHRRLSSGLLALAGALAALTGCFQELDSGADRETSSTPLSGGASTVILPADLPIELNPEDETQTTDDPCVKTRRDKTQILTAFCASCHSGPGSRGLPPFDFVLDDKKLVSQVWSRVGQPDQRFVIPGDPDHSALYLRATSDMPPIPTDLGTKRTPAPSWSDLSLLREWIAHCL
jgi:hypothetical protein